MEWQKNMNKAINYLEEHIEEEINMNELAKIACCSGYHFQRIFSYIVGLSLSEYVRRRKMTKSVYNLRNGEKVIDVAVKYGYDSATAFNRAFQSVHGLPPSLAKNDGVVLKAYPPISFRISITGEVEMNFRIEKREAFRIIGFYESYLIGEDSSQEIAMFWQKLAMEGKYPELLSRIGEQLNGLLGVSQYVEGNDTFEYFIAVASEQEPAEGMNEVVIPEGMWAVFESLGPLPHALQALQKRIILEWLPSSGYEYADAPDIEVYFEGNQQAMDYRCEVWLPIRKA